MIKIYIDKIICGDSYEVLRKMPSKSVHCIVTSPPYWSLRNYDHDKQIGIENTFEEYLERMIAVFEECKRVLTDTGTLFINIGDTYAGSGNGTNSSEHESNVKSLSSQRWLSKGKTNKKTGGIAQSVKNVAKKSQLAIPERLKIALIDKGWVCRNTIIWHKPNCMPESVKDRFTNDFEYIFFFTKQGNYTFNQLKEPLAESSYNRAKYGSGKDAKQNSGKYRIDTNKSTKYNNKVNQGQVTSRNKRAVWAITLKHNKSSHFATFPEDLAEQCILAGSNKGAVVMDIFLGSGTTAAVAKRLGRKFIGIELNKEYCKIAKQRIDNI